MGGLEISTQMKVDDVTEIDAIGSVDAHTFHDLEEAFEELFQAESYQIIVKLDRLNYISSAGVGVLIGAVNRCQENSGDIVFVNPTGSVKEVFDLIGLNDMFTTAQSVKAAREAILRRM